MSSPLTLWTSVHLVEQHLTKQPDQYAKSKHSSKAREYRSNMTKGVWNRYYYSNWRHGLFTRWRMNKGRTSVILGWILGLMNGMQDPQLDNNARACVVCTHTLCHVPSVVSKQQTGHLDLEFIIKSGCSIKSRGYPYMLHMSTPSRPIASLCGPVASNLSQYNFQCFSIRPTPHIKFYLHEFSSVL